MLIDRQFWFLPNLPVLFIPLKTSSLSGTLWQSCESTSEGRPTLCHFTSVGVAADGTESLSKLMGCRNISFRSPCAVHTYINKMIFRNSNTLFTSSLVSTSEPSCENASLVATHRINCSRVHFTWHNLQKKKVEKKV